MSEKGSENKSIARSAGLVSLLTLVSRVLGLTRDAVIAAFFRKGGTDAFFVAFTIPNVLRRLLAEGSLTVAFIPVFTEYREKHGEDEARLLVRSTLGVAMLALVLVSALGMLAAPWLVHGFAHGLARDPHKLALTVLLTRVMFPFLITVGLTALAMGVLNTYRHFAAPAFAPVLLNICIISCVAALSGSMAGWGWPRTMAVACGVLVGGVAQLLLQLPVLRGKGMLVAPRLGFSHPGVRRILRLMGPSVFALAIYQINVMLARLLASFLAEGSISYVYYAQRLIEFPIGIFAVALATVSMPSLSAQATAGDIDQVKRTFGYALRLVFFVMLPATAGLAALGLPLTAMLFQRGRYTHDMAQQTAFTLLGFTTGLWAAGGVRQAQQVYYAMQDTRTPVIVSFVSLCVFSASGFLLYKPLGTFGLALAVSLASSVNFVILVAVLRRRMGALGLRSVGLSALRATLAAAPCGAAAWAIARLGDWTLGARSLTNIALLLGAVVAGIVIYIGLARLLGSRELGELYGAVRRRRKR
ncbi:MAG: murein biosynthesis integral membrane protein MurJ [Myxococcales bacterium]|nr:murein biosynthesis integral membrane protein MurJ [Myxococcales bacterium]